MRDNTSSVSVKYMHTDELGSPIAITNASKAVMETTEYEPYGQVLNRSLRDGIGYTGREEESYDGLLYAQQR